jgi:hypothetical protein
MRKRSPSPKSLDTRRRILDYIAEYRKIPPYFQSPSLREIAAHVSLTTTPTRNHIKALIADGKLLSNGTPRGLISADYDAVGMLERAHHLAEVHYGETAKETSSRLEEIFREQWSDIAPKTP